MLLCALLKHYTKESIFMSIQHQAFARAGLIGNPSDGYFGKTISFVIREFSAQVELTPSDSLELIPNEAELPKYESLESLHQTIKLNGYYGAERLFKATLIRFADYCERDGIELHDRNFSLRYSSTVPRRVGMAGSSALITATMRCLLEFYDVEIPKPLLADLIWRIENEELGIGSGLQDRVIQVYEGCVFMDFDKDTMDTQGYGNYEEVDLEKLPNLYVAFRTRLAEGSEVFHNNIRERWDNGDHQVIDAMQQFGGFAQQAYDLMQAGRVSEVGPLMDKNFDLRKTLFQLSEGDLAMVDMARSVGAHAKFSGSGGAIVGTYEDDAMFAKLEEEFRNTDIELVKPTVAPPE
ncbi:MAG: GHMP kinase [Candidatus Hydrogenedentota bacterium]